MLRSLIIPVLLASVLQGCISSRTTTTSVGARRKGAEPRAERLSKQLSAMTDDELAARLIVASGANETCMHALDLLADSLRKESDLSPEVVKRLRREATSEKLVRLMVPAYLEHHDRPSMIDAIVADEAVSGEAPPGAVSSRPNRFTKESVALGYTLARTLFAKTVAEQVSARP